MLRVVAVRRTWVQAFSLPSGFSIGIKYSSDNSFVFLDFLLLNVAKRLRLPAHIRICLNPGKTLRFISYNLPAYRLAVTWMRTFRHMVWGAVAPFTLFLEVRGLGYRLVAVNQTRLEFGVGYSHLISYKLPEGISALSLGAKARVVQLSGADWLMLTQTVSALKRLRRANAYKERGIFRKWEVSARLKSSKRKKN